MVHKEEDGEYSHFVGSIDYSYNLKYPQSFEGEMELQLTLSSTNVTKGLQFRVPD